MPTTPNFSQPAIFSEVATPTVPDSGYLKVYANSGTLCSIANGGSEKAYVVSTDLSSYLPLAGGTLVGDLKFTDATYDIGKSGATRPRDGFFSRYLYADTLVPRQIILNNGTSNKLLANYTSQLIVASDWSIAWAANTEATSGGDVFLWRDAAGTLALRNDTAAQTFRVYNTYTSSTSFETLQFKAVAASAYQIGSAIGSAGGTNRAITFGHWNSGGTFTSSISVNTDGTLTFLGSYGLVSNNYNLQLTNTTSAAFACTAFGFSASAGHSSTVAIGTNSTTTAAGQCVIGGNAAGITSVFIGNGVTHGTPDSVTYNATGGSGTNIAGASFTLAGGKGTGTGLGGSLKFQVSPAGSSGSSLNSLADVLVIDSTKLSTFAGPITLTQPVSASGSPTAFTITGAAHTTLTASTEATDVNFNLARTVQFATGAISTQRAMRIQAPTYGFVGASTITTASTLSISGAPVAGTNATITNPWALNVESGNTYLAGNVTSGGNFMTPQYGSAGFPILSFGNGDFGLYAVFAGIGFKAYGATAAGAFNSGLQVTSGSTISWSSTSVVDGGRDLALWRDAAGVLATRNGTNAQSFGVYGTWTSTTSYERVNVRGKASANFEIGPENGSAGGTLRGLTIGGYSAGSSTITPWMSFTGSTGELGIFGNGIVRQSKYGDDTTAAIYTLRKYRGTEASPTALNSGDTIAQILFQGYHGATIGNVAAIQVVATEAFTSSPVNRPTRMLFNTTGPLDTQSTVRMTIDDSGDVGIGTTTISARAHVVSTTEQLRIGYNLSNYYSTTVSSAGAVTFDAAGSAPLFAFSKLVGQSAAEITNTPAATTQTITLNNGNHQTLTLTSATGTVAVTLTVPSKVSSGTIIVKQHATTPRNITWAVSAGTIKWMGTQPTWSSDAVNDIRIVSWRYDGSVMYLMSTDKAA